MFGNKKEGEGGSWRVWLIVIGALCGVLLLVFGSGLGSRSDRNAAPADTVDAEEELAAYRTSLAADIRALCESVEGVSDVTVALTLSGGFRDVYATEAARDGGEQYVIVGSGRECLGSPAVPERAGGQRHRHRLPRRHQSRHPAGADRASVCGVSRSLQPDLYHRGKKDRNINVSPCIFCLPRTYNVP